MKKAYDEMEVRSGSGSQNVADHVFAGGGLSGFPGRLAVHGYQSDHSCPIHGRLHISAVFLLRQDDPLQHGGKAHLGERGASAT